MPALLLAVELGASCIEMDVQLTKDEVPVIFHDDTLDRIFAVKGKIEDFTYHELSTLDAGNWFADEFEGTKILTLKDALIFAQNKNITLDIELKDQNNSHILCKKVLDCINRYCDNKNKIIFSSFSIDNLLSINKLDKDFKLGFAMHDTNDIAKLTSEISIDFFVINKDIINDKFFAQIIQDNKEIYVYTVNDIERWKYLSSLGVNGVFVDEIKKF